MFKTDQETLRDLSNLRPDDCLQKIAEELKVRLVCETACILLWHEVWDKDRTKRRILVTEYRDGLPEKLREEIYGYGEGITGGYIFADGKTIRATVRLRRREIIDSESGAKIEVENTNWTNLEQFGKKSVYGDFRSLLSLPLIVKNQKIGVIKLINKLENGRLKETGFEDDDLKRLKSFLSTIELVIETKTYERQIEGVFAISRKITSADFEYDDLLQEIARCCADTLNQRLCIIRMLDHKVLEIKGCSEIAERTFFDDFSISRRAIEMGQPIYFDGKAFRDLGPTSRKYADKPPAIFKSEAFRINSMITVPVIYQKRAVGVIECYTTLSPNFSDRMTDAVEAYGTLVATLFQRNRIKEGIYSLVTSFSLLEGSQKVYESVITSIEQYLDTKKVSIWEKKAKRHGFAFDRVKTSPSFEESFQMYGISSLNKRSKTAQVAETNKIEHLNGSALDQASLQHPDFIRKNGLRSLTIVPIFFGGQCKAVIDVFYEEDRELLKEDEDFLRLLASKASGAIWNKSLTLSFSAINDALLSAPNVETLLNNIVAEARRVLYADPVILFRFDPEREELKPPVLEGRLNDRERIYSGKEKQEDFVNLMLGETKPVYLESTAAYKEFCQIRGTLRPWTEDDFWHREGIQSMAAVTLFASSQKPVGVMFFNYKAAPFVFDDSTKNAIESFAARAASAIVSGSFTGTRIQEMATEQIIRSVVVQLDDLGTSLAIKGTDPDLTKLLGELQEKLTLARGHLDFSSPSETTTIGSLIDTTLRALADRLQTHQINLRRNYGDPLPLRGDARRITGLFYAVVEILIDAKTPSPGTLTITTRRVGDRIQTDMVLGGGRVLDDQLNSILHQPISASAKDNESLPDRFDLCEQLASSVTGQVAINARKESVWARITLPIK